MHSTALKADDARVLAVLQGYFGLGEKLPDELLRSLDHVDLPGGDWLFHQGAPGDALYLLVRGRLQVWLEDDGSGRLGPPQLIGRVTPGDSVGELALLSGAARSAGVRAVRDSELVRIDRQRFHELAQKYPQLSLMLAERAARLAQHQPPTGFGPTRNLSTIALVALDDCESISRGMRDLSEALGAFGKVEQVNQEALPRGDAASEAELADLRRRMRDQEDRSRLLLMHCPAGNSAWNRFALRQADLVVLLADANANPQPREWEGSLGLSSTDTTARRMLLLLQPDAEFAIANTQAWYRGRQVDFHLHLRLSNRADAGRAARVLMGKATGLVLGAGASRGFAHLGVYRALYEWGVPVDWIGGTSIGGIMGSVIAQGWEPQRCIDLVRETFVGGKPYSDVTLPLVSLLSGGRMRRMLKKHADQQIEDLPIPFFCLSANLDDGSPNLHKSGSLWRALSATASIPGVLPPTVVNGRLAVDGSVLNSLPVDLMWQQPVGKVIAVSLAVHRKLEVDYEEVPSAWALLLGRWLPMFPHYRVPGMSTVMLKATELATLAAVRDQGRRATLLLEPDVRQFGLTDLKSFDQIIETGYRTAMQVLSREDR